MWQIIRANQRIVISNVRNVTIGIITTVLINVVSVSDVVSYSLTVPKVAVTF